MSKDQEAPGGGVILRHTERARDFELAVGSPESIEAVAAHMERHVGPIHTVFHELISDCVHVDVHVVAPRPERDWWTLFTTGMSDRPMNAPEGEADSRFAELMISLPPEWRVEYEAFKDERWYWPVRCLKTLARLPHEYDTWLGPGHTVPNGDPAKPYADGTRFCCMMLLPPLTLEPEASSVVLPDGRTVHLYALHALHPEEMSLKLNKGLDPLLDAFDDHAVHEVLDPARPSSVRRRLFGLF